MRSRVTVAENMKRFRKKRGLTQNDVAESAGLARPYLSKLESADVNVSLDNLDKLADVFKIETWKLVKNYGLSEIPLTKNSLVARKPRIIGRQRKAKK